MFSKEMKMLFSKIVYLIVPPLFIRGVLFLKKITFKTQKEQRQSVAAGLEQDIDVYWDSKMATVLETWGEQNVWKEIPLLMVNCKGKTLDIACGTGKTMEILSKFPIDIFGCDISDMLINKAIERGILRDHLLICDATKMSYENDSFDYAYSIGSLEHFTEEGITKLLQECYRVTKYTSFHMIPVSRSGKNEGWLKTYQSFHNNSVAWWLEKYKSVYPTVFVLDSTWEDDISVGKWFVCVRSES